MTDRPATWMKIRVLFDLAWKDHGLDAPKIAALEGLGLIRHPDVALLAAAEILVRELKWPPTPADWFGLLERGATRKEVEYRKDCWGRTILGRDGAPIIASMRDVQEQPRVYALLGLPAPLSPRLLDA